MRTQFSLVVLVLSAVLLAPAAAQLSYPVPSGIVSWWTGDATADDIVGDNHGTLLGNTTFGAGVVGDAFYFDGSKNTGVMIGDEPEFEQVGALTLEAWVCTTDPTAGHAILMKAYSFDFGNKPSWLLRKYWDANDGTIGFNVGTDRKDMRAEEELRSTTSIADGQFHHVVGTYDGAQLRLYVDAQLEDTRGLTGTVRNGADLLVIGNYGGRSNGSQGPQDTYSFMGAIDEARFYDRALTDTEIADIFTSVPPVFCDNRNTAPVADAGDDSTVECAGPGGTAVTLNGLLSSDADGDTLTFTWQGPFPEGGGTVTGPMPTVTLARGSHTLTLTVMDTYGEMSTDTVTVTVEDTQAPVLSGVPADVTVEATGPGGAAFALALPSATDTCEGPVPVSSDAPAVFPLGQTLVTFSAADSSGNSVTATTVVTVVDTTAPDVGDVTPSKASLWPPNHKMVSVDVAVAVSDLVDAYPVCQIASVASNQPIDGLGDGDTSPDWIVTGALSVDLRAERAGGGSGRVYTITVECSDADANAALATTSVSVPRSRGR